MNILACITTYDSYAYVDLSLAYLKQKFNIPCIVLDDGSYSSKLQNVCDKHEVFLIGKTKPKEEIWGMGDLISTINAIRYASFHGYDYILKISRRWICLDNPIPSLNVLINISDGSTYSSWTSTWNFGFRTEFMCLRTKEWMQVVPEMEERVKYVKTNPIGLVEAFIHKYAKRFNRIQKNI